VAPQHDTQTIPGFKPSLGQHWPSQIPNAGEGLYATKRFAKGERIADYTGEKLSRAQVGKRYPDNVRPGHIASLLSLAVKSSAAAGSAAEKTRFRPAAEGASPCQRPGSPRPSHPLHP
jgi:hypothetical protein